MSGGHYGYAYSNINSLANDIEPKTVLRQLFKNHLLLVAEAARAIEWNDSGDGSPDETKLIRQALGPEVDTRLLGQTLDSIRSQLTQLESVIDSLNSKHQRRDRTPAKSRRSR